MKSSIITAIIFLVLISVGCDNGNGCTISVGEPGVPTVIVVPVSQNEKDGTTQQNQKSDNNGNVTVNTPAGVPCSSVQVTIPGSPQLPINGK